MSDFRATVLAIEAIIRKTDLVRLKLATRRSLIAYALRGRDYSASVAADRAGKLDPVPCPSAATIAVAADRFRLSAQERAALSAAIADVFATPAGTPTATP